MAKFRTALAKLLATVGALSLSGAVAGLAQSGPFSSVEQAREYLDRNPAGPLAEEAFKFIILQQIGQKEPGFDANNVVEGEVTQRTRRATADDDDDDDPGNANQGESRAAQTEPGPY